MPTTHQVLVTVRTKKSMSTDHITDVIQHALNSSPSDNIHYYCRFIYAKNFKRVVGCTLGHLGNYSSFGSYHDSAKYLAKLLTKEQ